MKTKTQRILAIDPGFRRIGFALLEEGHLIDFGVRLIERRQTLKEAFQQFERTADRLITDRRPNFIALEQTAFSQIRNNIRLAIAVQVLHRLARAHHVRIASYNPRTIRKAVCDDGNATKRELARTIVSIYPETRVYLESNRRWRERHFQVLYDAIACGLTHERKTQSHGTSPSFENRSLTK